MYFHWASQTLLKNSTGCGMMLRVLLLGSIPQGAGPLASRAAPTCLLSAPKSMTMVAYSPPSSRGLSSAPASAAVMAALVRPASPSQSASPVMHAPVFTPALCASGTRGHDHETAMQHHHDDQLEGEVRTRVKLWADQLGARSGSWSAGGGHENGHPGCARRPLSHAPLSLPPTPVPPLNRFAPSFRVVSLQVG